MRPSARKTASGGPDGRALRSERSRQLIVDSMLELVTEGNLVPTAQQVAERAKVGIRTIFRHFPEMDSLYTSTDERLRGTYENLFLGGDREGTLEERILHAVERHANAYEAVGPLLLSALVQHWKSEVIRKNYARNLRGLRKDLNAWLPELEQLPASEREAVDAIASFETWHRLREHQNLGKQASIDIIVMLLSKLIAE
ncbi:MAG: TetR/AcrR family transcriptional regulator [Gammaproteobacteria bacterium]|nr:TetR/AcrR family transcriptional regulator [Gammaproteobacteria bacterium]